MLAIHQGFVRPCLSEAIIAEYATVLARPKFAFRPEEIEAVLAMLQSKGEIFRPEESPVVSPDPAQLGTDHFEILTHPASRRGDGEISWGFVCKHDQRKRVRDNRRTPRASE